MSDILIYAGTTEGRELSEVLKASGLECDVCVATEYGSRMIAESDLVHVHEGRLDSLKMKELHKTLGPKIIVDATHPYAAAVTENIREAAAGSRIRYIRLLRPESPSRGSKQGTCMSYASASECAEALSKTEGKILLTTGSKELAVFAKDEKLKGRLVARVLPGMESLELCLKQGLSGRQIIAMQGPFSREMNLAQIHQYGISHLVTKESGVIGGEDSKLAAAFEAGIVTHVIRRPVSGVSREQVMSMDETVREIESILGVRLSTGRLEIALAGIGCGSRDLMTGEVRDAVGSADYIFGAARMLKTVHTGAVCYPYYRREDILPVLKGILDEHSVTCRVVVLFSGDTGFFSGCASLYEALKDEPRMEVRILPGISSVSLLAARCGISWSNAHIMSMHGTKEDWSGEFFGSVRHNGTTMFITSGVGDVNRIGRLMKELDLPSGEARILLGYQLSYENEITREFTPEECMALKAQGLYVGAVVRGNPEPKFPEPECPEAWDTEPKILVPYIEDEEFIRAKVPMTKESVRALSIMRLGLTDRSVLYDIGSGTGSIAVQAAKLAPGVRVFAFECKDEAVDLIRQNAEKFGAHNIEAVRALAPDGFEGLPVPDCAFIGGSNGRLRQILDKLYSINPRMRVVMNAVSLESIGEMNALTKEFPVRDLVIEQCAVTRVKPVGKVNLMQANNPVFIFSFSFT